MATRPTPESYYYSGQGRVLIAERDALTGRPKSFFATGNVTALEIQIAVTNVDHKESMSGTRSLDLRLTTEKTVTFSMTLESLKLENMSLVQWGNSRIVPAGDATDEPHVFSKGGLYGLAFPKVSDVVVSAAGAPVVALGNYTYDEDFGTIYVNDTAPAFTTAGGTAVTVDYSYAEHQRIDALTKGTAPERFLRFEGLNTVDGTGALVEIPRASFDPMQAYPLINEELASMDISGGVLRDPLITNPTFSNYFTERRFTTDFAVSEEGALGS